MFYRIFNAGSAVFSDFFGGFGNFNRSDSFGRSGDFGRSGNSSGFFTSSSCLTGSSCLLVCVIAGVCACLFFDRLLPLSLLLLITLLSMLFACRCRLVMPLCIFCLSLTWATWQFTAYDNIELPPEFEGVTVQLNGRVVGLPSSQSGNSRFRFEIESSSEQRLQHLHGHAVQLSCYRCPWSILPDQQWLLSVRLKRPHGYASWGAFDYEKYLFRHQLLAKGYVRVKDDNRLLGSQAYSVNQWRWQIRQSLKQNLKDQQLGLAVMSALMIGDKSQLSDRQRKVFQQSGVSHLMAISGLHIGLVFMVVAWLFKWLLMPVARVFDVVPRQHLILLPAITAAFTYAALAGFAVSTQRALIMLSVFVLARLSARDLSLLKVLIISAVVVLFIDPFSILDVGFWLSFSAVLVIAISSTDSQKISLIRLQPMLWLGMLPLTLLFFGQISLVSPLVNLLMVPLFCIVLIPLTLLALLLLELGLQEPSHWLMLLLSVSYEWVFIVLQWLSELSVMPDKILAQIYLPPMSLMHWLVFCCVVLAYVLGVKRYIQGCLVALFVLSLLVIGPIIKTQPLADDELRVALLDVGQGLSMVVEAKNYVLVYDTGPAYASGFNAADAVLLPYLRHRGITHIDTLIISHADNDHIGGYPILKRAFPVTKVLTSRTDKLPEATPCIAGEHWQVAAIEFTILSPDKETPRGSNNHSCVLSISNGSVRVLITGDIERPVERYLLTQNKNLQADILLVPHQGSKTSSTNAFIDAVNPSLALLAAGYRNHYGHPHQSVVDRYKVRNIRLKSTIDSGSILLKINENNWSEQVYRQQRRGFWHWQKKAIN